MKLRTNKIIFLTTTLFVTLVSKSSLAFTIIPTQPGDSDGTFQYQESYEGGRGITKLDAWPILDPRRLQQGKVLEI